MQVAVIAKRLLDRLLREKKIDGVQFKQAMLRAEKYDEPGEEAVLAIGAITEAELLKYKSAIYQTQFVSTQKLSTAAADKAALSFIPRKAAEKLNVFPILYDRKTHRLSVVAADLEEHDVVKQVQLVTGLNQVVAYVARYAAIRALQRKHYRGDGRAFAELLSNALVPALAGAPIRGRRQAQQQRPPAVSVEPASGISVPPAVAPRFHDAPAPSGLPMRPPEATNIVAQASVAPSFSRTVPMPEPPPVQGPAAVPLEAAATEEGGAPALQNLEELLRVMVTLLEQGRGPLRGHSAKVARLGDVLAERMGLSAQVAQLHRIAAYCHDLGKGDTYHLTALNVAEYDGHRTQAKKCYKMGLSILDSVTFPQGVADALVHMYERYDGGGFPEGLKGKEIPLASRALAIVDTYADVTSHGKNPFRRVLNPREAWESLASFRGRVFDPDLMDLLRATLLKEGADGDASAQAGGSAGMVLVVDPDPEDTMVLELRLAERGYPVTVARTATEAVELASENTAAMICETELKPFDGYELVRRVREKHSALSVVFLTKRGDEASVKKGYAMGAADFLVKPVQPEVVAAKLEQVLLKRDDSGSSRGVSGSLKEMSLPDVIQILSNGRRSGTLSLSAKGVRGNIFFHDGALWDASFGTHQAAEAVYEMLTLDDGDFAFSRGGSPAERRIHDSTETLLLEGMRRLDER